MADDSKLRVPREPYRRAAEPARESSHSNDPLAELARIIGKSDPYAEFGRGGVRGEERRDPYPDSGRSGSAPSSAREHYAEEHNEPHDPRYDERYEDRYQDRHDERYEPRWDPAGRSESFASDRESYEATRDGPLTTPVGGWRSDHLPSNAEEPDFDPDSRGHADDQFGQAADHGQDEDADLEASADPQEEQEQSYDDPPRAYRHGGLATALALIGCAILGTAGAYAYRSYFGQPSVSHPPPVITADNATPVKIIPAPAGDQQSAKAIQDRVANAGKEQVVSKQEEPVALKDLGTQAAPRVVMPSPVAPSPTAPAAAPSASAPPLSGSTEPHKVRTLAIRPDGSDATARPMPTPSSASAAPRPATPTPRNSGGPLSLAPQAQDGAPPAAPRTRTAAAPPRTEVATGSSGGFLVQLSSQKTEAEAASSFRSLQAKYPNELGDRQPIIRRADLGTRGIFYRTMVGPFASAQEANQFCATYRAAGGHCVVPNN